VLTDERGGRLVQGPGDSGQNQRRPSRSEGAPPIPAVGVGGRRATVGGGGRRATAGTGGRRASARDRGAGTGRGRRSWVQARPSVGPKWPETGPSVDSQSSATTDRRSSSSSDAPTTLLLPDEILQPLPQASSLETARFIKSIQSVQTAEFMSKISVHHNLNTNPSRTIYWTRLASIQCWFVHPSTRMLVCPTRHSDAGWRDPALD
jgi:hypothetical protein